MSDGLSERRIISRRGLSRYTNGHSLQMDSVQMDTVHKWTRCTNGHGVQMDTVYKWTRCTNGHSAQMDTVHKWTRCTNGHSVQMDTVHKWTRCTNGHGVQMDTVYKWTRCTNGHSAQMDTAMYSVLCSVKENRYHCGSHQSDQHHYCVASYSFAGSVDPLQICTERKGKGQGQPRIDHTGPEANRGIALLFL